MNHRKRSSPPLACDYRRDCKRISSCNATTTTTTPSGGSKSCSLSSSTSSSLSNDLLHHIFAFFVSTGTVDGDSLLAASLTCQQWKDAAYAPSLWAQIHPSPSTEKVDCQDNNDQEAVDLIHSALSIRECTSPALSLIGFVKLRTHASSDGMTWYDARERAYGTPCLLAISKSRRMTTARPMIQELFQGHFEQATNFLEPITTTSRIPVKAEDDDCGANQYPRGIAVVNGRIVRWYEGTFRDRESKRRPGVPKQDNLPHLLELEKSYIPSIDRPRLRIDHWATLVDWVVEIVECFDLEDQTAFRAMSFMDRFLSSTCGTNQNPLKRSHYQLVAGSALFLASQCSRSKSTLSVNDISFCADNSYTGDQVQATANVLLQKMEWKLAIPTPLDFAQAYINLDATTAKSSRETPWMVRQVVELALQTPIHLSYQPSVIAASAVILARYCVQDPDVIELWSESLQRATGYSLMDLKSCCMELSGRLEEIQVRVPNLIMVSRRYRAASRGSVADVSIPSLSSFDLIVNYEPPRRRIS